ncbi:MAG: DUF1289 domain-containing protein [Paracoccus sp. (in: a-proteobacteria)]|nr:DUF1289 domain-containing protein [Paracoccus sp. (in: a-proteobacteria)]
MTNDSAKRPRRSSPCIRRCALDAAGQICTGCLRTVDEITRWSSMSPAEQDRVLARLARLHRRKTSDEPLDNAD